MPFEPSYDNPFNDDPFNVPAVRPVRIDKPTKKNETQTNGLQAAKAWTLALSRCKNVTPMAKLTGSVIREHVHTKNMTVYIGSEKLAEITGWHERHVKSYRSALRDNGWLADTGDHKGRAIVWRLEIPECTCDGCSTTVTESVTVKGDKSSTSRVTESVTVKGDKTCHPSVGPRGDNPGNKGDRFGTLGVTDPDIKGDKSCDANSLSNNLGDSLGCYSLEEKDATEVKKRTVPSSTDRPPWEDPFTSSEEEPPEAGPYSSSEDGDPI